jgi:predicted dehydrogenase
MEAPTVAVIGARRVRNGTGPYLARHAAALGARVVAVLGTSTASAGEAADWLADQDIAAQPFTDFARLVEAHRPEVLVVASPTGTHGPWLEQGLAAGCHVLCEKPILDGETARTMALAQAYAAAGLRLEEVCQWPWTLGAFRELHPEVDLTKVQRFRMLLAPPLRGLLRWQEMLSHPLSLLLEVLPGPLTLHDVRFHEGNPEQPDVRVEFTLASLEREVEVEFVLEDLGRFPRPAEYALDGHLCRRVVAEADYGISFTAAAEGSEGAVAVEDPLKAQVAAFLEAVAAIRDGRAAATIDERLVRRQDLLEQLLAAYAAQTGA